MVIYNKVSCTNKLLIIHCRIFNNNIQSETIKINYKYPIMKFKYRTINNKPKPIRINRNFNSNYDSPEEGQFQKNMLITYKVISNLSKTIRNIQNPQKINLYIFHSLK